MPNINSPRYQRWYIQQQSVLTSFNNSTGAWNTSGAQLLRVDAGSVSLTRNAPYSRFPVLTGTKSEVAGIRGRKGASWSIRGLPVIPCGSSAAPDMDILFQNIFGAANSTGTYSFNDAGYLPFSLFGFAANFPTLTSRAMWGCFITRATFNFNGNFFTVDLDGFGGYEIDSTGFSVFDTQAKAGLTTFPTDTALTTVAGSPIQGFGNGYTATFHSNTFELKIRAMSVTIETGYEPIADVYGSPYLVAVVGGARRISVNLGTLLDDDSTALNDLKTQADTDTTGATTMTASILVGNTANNRFTFNLNAIQANAFDLRDDGNTVAFSLPTSYAHATAIGNTNDMTLVFS